MTSPTALPTRTAAPWRYRLLATAAFICAIFLLALPFRATIATIGFLHRLPLADATTDTNVLANATACAGTYWPGRVACVETSLTLILAAAFTGRRLYWCLGGRFDPPATHAWGQTPDGNPIGERDSENWPWITALRI